MFFFLSFNFSLSPRGYLNQIKCCSDITDIDIHDTSFSIFLLVLRTSLQRFDPVNGLNQAKKVLGMCADHVNTCVVGQIV